MKNMKNLIPIPRIRDAAAPFLWVSLVTSLALITACTSTAPAEPQDTPLFLSHTKEVVIPLHPEWAEASPRMTLRIAVSDVSGDMGRLIQELLYDGAGPSEYTERLIASYTDQYFAMRHTEAEYPDLPTATLNWEYTETLEADSPSSRILVLSRNREYYLGGAHGMREKQYVVIFHDTQKIEQVRLEDILKAGAFPDLERHIVEELRKQANLATDTPLSEGGFFEDTPGVPENFFLSAQGVGFHWDPYAIAPYVMGSLEVILPYEQIQDLLKPGIPW
jgi:hypothetical protein